MKCRMLILKKTLRIELTIISKFLKTKLLPINLKQARFMEERKLYFNKKNKNTIFYSIK